MSLIDDALRRAQEEAERQEEAHRKAQRPWIPPEPPRPRRRRTAALAFVAVAAVAAALWVSLRRPSPRAGAILPAARPKSLPPPKLDTVEVPPPNAAPLAKPAPAPPVAIAPPRAAAAHPETRRPRTAPALADGRTFVRTVPLGDGRALDLDGIVFSESNPVAVIGGKVLGPGGIVDDFQIVRIEANRVTLRGRGVTIFVSLS